MRTFGGDIPPLTPTLSTPGERVDRDKGTRHLAILCEQSTPLGSSIREEPASRRNPDAEPPGPNCAFFHKYPTKDFEAGVRQTAEAVTPKSSQSQPGNARAATGMYEYR